MDLASQKFRRILDERARLASHGVRVRVLGDLNRLPEDLRALIAQAQEATVANKLRTLNVAFSYTSREELAQVRLLMIHFFDLRDVTFIYVRRRYICRIGYDSCTR